ncbi:MAG: single-stranded DNA-binding protein [Verrucomicrobia bacterium]|nr:single-stranded DNA-binding protein [Verrucomicrobiota bacterium]MCH8526134.1 single-stranded DNA-binding protein [Kiritimatiellia bacterium]
MTHIEITRAFAEEVNTLSFSPPVAAVYNPLQYAWEPHKLYLGRTKHPVQVLFMGMNPGPWGMAQTGVPFGEVSRVRDWLGIQAPVGKPPREHPKRPITGFDCARSEVSGRRLWDFFRETFQTADRFFAACTVHNYCPLVFMSETGANLTPDKLPSAERKALEDLCTRHLVRMIELLSPRHLVGIGAYAESKLRVACPGREVVRILHPSPASPAANRDWAGTVLKQLQDSGVFPIADT